MNHTAPAYISRTSTPVPFEYGQATTQRLLDIAYRDGLKFAVDISLGRHLLSLGGRPVGLLNPSDSSFIAWPHIPATYSRDKHIARLHSYADKSRTFGKCYFIGGDTGHIKIGFSVDVPNRLKALQSGSPIMLRVLAMRDGGQEREAAYHEQFSQFRQHGEWFERVPEIEAEIARLASIALAVGLML